MNIANKITMLRIFMIPIFVACFMKWGISNVIPLLIFVIASLTDTLDGYLARKYELVTTFGKFLDPIADKLLVVSAFVMLVADQQIPGWIVIVIISREFIITGFRVIAASSGTTIAASGFGKIKTITQFASIILYLTNIEIPTVKIIALYIALIFTVLSGVDYIVKNISILDLENI